MGTEKPVYRPGESKSADEAFRGGQSDGATGKDTHRPDGGFIDTILDRPFRDCDNDVRDAAYDAGKESSSGSKDHGWSWF